MRRMLKVVLVAALILGVSESAFAQSVRVKCSSENEGTLVTRIQPGAFEYDAENASAEVLGYSLGTMRNGEIEVRVSLELIGAGRNVRYHRLELLFIPVDGSPGVGATVAAWQRREGIAVTPIGLGIDPEGVECSFLAKMPIRNP